MVTKTELHSLLMALDGVTHRPHFDRIAYRVRRSFVTLASDEKTANFLFTPDDQHMRCTMFGDVFSPVPNKWGAQGWTTGRLDKMNNEIASSAVTAAWQIGAARNPKSF